MAENIAASGSEAASVEWDFECEWWKCDCQGLLSVIGGAESESCVSINREELEGKWGLLFFFRSGRYVQSEVEKFTSVLRSQRMERNCGTGDAKTVGSGQREKRPR